ncbi:hypothetical protein [Gemmata massiliana]|nr:hypothetical protein [Gemmata massiliana]
MIRLPALLVLVACVFGCSKKGKPPEAQEPGEAVAAVPASANPRIGATSPGKATDSAQTVSPSPVIENPISTDGKKTEADARAWVQTKIDATLKDGPAPAFIMTTETGNPNNPKAALPFKRFNPELGKLFGEFFDDIHSETIRSIKIEHCVKLRRGEFCPLVEEDAFLVHVTIEGDKGTDRCVRSMHFMNDTQLAKRIAYRRKVGYPDVMPGDEDWSSAYTSIYSPSYAENVRRINEYRRKK